VQFQPSSMPDEWGTTQDGQTRPRVVKRGIDDDHDQVPDGSEFIEKELMGRNDINAAGTETTTTR